jgi:hypothetical protein
MKPHFILMAALLLVLVVAGIIVSWIIWQPSVRLL